METKTILQRIEKETDNLSQEEQLELVERLVHKLRKKGVVRKKEMDWDQLYGVGKGVWEEDAQEYVDSLREDRV